MQCLSRARKIRENKVFVVKIPSNTPDMVTDGLEDCPIFASLVANVNTELQNGTRGVLECFALDAGYTIKHEDAGFSPEVMAAAEAAELHKDLGMVYANIEDLKHDVIVESLRGRQAAQIATTGEMLRLEKYFYKLMFPPDTDEAILAHFWDEGLTRVAKALYSFRQSENPIRAALPDVRDRKGYLKHIFSLPVLKL